MKSILFAALALLILPNRLSAQHVGASFGWNSSTVDWQYPKPQSPCLGCVYDAEPNARRESTAIAVSAVWRAQRWIGVTSELRYTPKGYAITQPTLNVDYLEVPVLARFGRLSGQGVPVAPFVEVGPALAVRMQCRVRYNQTTDPCRNGVAFGQDWRIRRFDASAIGGAGIAVRVRSNVLLAGLRVDWGLRDIGGPEGVPTKNRSTLTYVTWLAPLPRFAR